MTEEFLSILVSAAGTVFTALVGMLSAYVVKLIKSKISDTRVARVLQTAAECVSASVRATAQTYVDELKKTAASMPPRRARLLKRQRARRSRCSATRRKRRLPKSSAMWTNTFRRKSKAKSKTSSKRLKKRRKASRKKRRRLQKTLTIAKTPTICARPEFGAGAYFFTIEKSTRMAGNVAAGKNKDAQYTVLPRTFRRRERRGVAVLCGEKEKHG